MNTREEIHETIDELLGQLSIHNNRLSLHEEKLSQLDIDVLRKLCIDLYDKVNRLVLEGKLSGSAAKAEQPVQKEKASVPEPAKEEEPIAEPVAQKEEVAEDTVKQAAPEVELKQEQKKAPAKPQKHDAEMISLFEKFNSKPIDEINKAISISKRFEFQNNFFDGDSKNYKAFIDQLDQAGDREAAFEIYHDYKNRLNWENEELKDELKSLLYRKYNT